MSPQLCPGPQAAEAAEAAAEADRGEELMLGGI